MAYSARSLSTNLLQENVRQINHEFSVGQVLRFNGAAYVLAEANNATNANTLGMVSFVIDSNTFSLTQVGYISQIPFGLTPGQQYYLSPTVPGGITMTAPSGGGEYVVALFVPDSLSSGYYFNNEAVSTAGVIPGFTWSVVTANTPMLVNNGYIINGAGLLTMTLPLTAAAGSVFEIAGSSASGWSVAQNAGQTLHMGDVNSTTGNTGSVSSTLRYDTLRIVCSIANTDFVWLSGVGNLTVV